MGGTRHAIGYHWRVARHSLHSVFILFYFIYLASACFCRRVGLLPVLGGRLNTRLEYGLVQPRPLLPAITNHRRVYSFTDTSKLSHGNLSAD
jgi:hypothetical protein